MGRPLSPPQIHQKNIWTLSKFHKTILIAGRGHQAPRKAAHCLQKEVGKNTKDKKRDKRGRDGAPSWESKVKSLSCARLFATPWIVACTKLLRPWDFQSKKYWSGLPFPSPKPLLIWRLALLSSSSVLLSNADWLDRHQVSTFCHSTSVTAKNIFYPSLES